MSTGTSTKSAATGRAAFGTAALFAAFIIVVLQAVGTGYDRWPDLLAVLLAVAGSGLRIEAAIAAGRGVSD
ncbi:hypothetical protein GCM10009854_23330 [Saccharopolyspora halophila]|uniref:Heavy metal translocating P-type ATPase n=1 Tax=Saccharopolyspora halophila TaxID=405551 RepID=A0ABN3G7H3_9PSEU